MTWLIGIALGAGVCWLLQRKPRTDDRQCSKEWVSEHEWRRGRSLGDAFFD